MKAFRVLVILGVFFLLLGCGQGAKLVQHTVDVDTLFSNYEWFTTTYHDIQAMAPKIQTAYAMYTDKTVTGDTKLNYQTNYSGLVNILNDRVQEYNARSSMWNRTIAKDKKLPYMIKVNVNNGDVSFSEE